MSDEIVEGEVFDPEEGPWTDPRIYFEVRDFQTRMDQMKQVYEYAAEGIRWGAFPPPPAPAQARKQGIGSAAARRCGKALVIAGQWLLKQYPEPNEAAPTDPEPDEWAWTSPTTWGIPAQLPMPNFDRGVNDD